MAPEGLKLIQFRRTRRRPRLLPRRAKALLALGLLLLAVRAILPLAALVHARRALDGMEGCRATIEDVDVRLWRGAYRINELRLEKTSADAFSPFFYAKELEVSLDWEALLGGSWAAALTLRHPVLNLVRGPTESSSQLRLDPDWRQRLGRLAPAPLDRVRVEDGQLTYRDHESGAPSDLVVRDIQLWGRGLASVRRPGALAAEIHASAAALGAARLSLNLRADAGAQPPAFRLDASLRDASAVEFDGLLPALGGFKASSGTISLFISASAQEGRIKGTAKAVFEDLRLSAWRGREAEALGRFMAALRQEAGQELQTPGPRRLAATIPLSSPAAGPDLVSGVFGALREAFLRSLVPGVYFLRPQ